MAVFFKDWIFQQFPRYHRVNDTYKNAAGEGILQRYLRTFGDELDENVVPYINNFLDLVDTIKCPDKYLPLLGGILGYPPSIDGLPATYRKILAFAVAIYKIKGTNRSFSLLFNIIGIDTITIQEEIPKKKIIYDEEPDPNLYDEEPDPNLYDSECEYCSGYHIHYIAPADLDAETVEKVNKIICFLNPINAKFLGLIRD